MTVSPLVVLDCDSTTIQDEVIELIAEAAGTRKEVAAVTERAMRGELDFAESLRERVATLEGVPQSVFDEVYAKVRLSPGIRELISDVHSRGGKVGVVSGGFHEVLDLIADDLGIDYWSANRLEIEDGKLTGRTIGPVIDAEAKANTLREWAATSGTPMSATVAIGDGANDLLMMKVAQLGIGYNAKPIVIEQADESIKGDLSLAIPLLDRLQ
ncbi:phosphoserine phosphatase SerB [Leucobacter denitrificans]|uniref:phosphoserine phosphatase n=1 Tax=Leucobacter denitrificans TaxID=683042 RepID=A0A7G9S5V2_9MICO|nr:phosphoserine phosphatase SerB [Leucobacter denitrificans]QNN63227.1 phosphoserine phosphatase SerB [Leucobacter denitrificans]